MSIRDLGVVRETSSAILQHSESGFELDQVNHYVFVGKLGEGASGEVFEVIDEYTKERFAMKCFPSKSILRRRGVETKRVGRKMTQVGNAFEDVLKEIAIMKRIHHPNLVKLVEIIDDAQIDRLFMILELVEGGTVMEWNVNAKRFTPNALLCENANSTTLSTKFAQRVMRDCIRGLDYLHESKVMHRDLKPQNLLLDRHTLRVKIADFGTSLAMDHVTDGMLQNTKGTFSFYAPECCSAGAPMLFDGYKADVWSLGVCLFCFLTGTLPFYDADPTVLFERIRTAPIPLERLSPSTSQEEIDVVKLLLERDVSLRPATACKLMDMDIPWLGRIYRDKEASTRNIADVSEKEIHEALSTVLRVAGFAKMWRRRTIANLQHNRSALKFTLSSSDLSLSAEGTESGGSTTPRTTVRHRYSKSDQSTTHEFNNTSARSLLSRSSLDSSTRSLTVEIKPDSQGKLNCDELDAGGDTLTPALSRLSTQLLLQPVEEEIIDDLQRLGGSIGALPAPNTDVRPPLLKRRSSRSLKRGTVKSRSSSSVDVGPSFSSNVIALSAGTEEPKIPTKKIVVAGKPKKSNTAVVSCCAIL